MEFNDFKRLYPLSKTLRFEAKPIGATLKNIIKSGLLEEDEHRAQSYVKVKKLIDEYYKPEFGISDCRFSCYARFPIGAYYICPPNNMDGKMQEL